MKFFLQKLKNETSAKGYGQRNNIFLLYSPESCLAFMIREIKPLASFLAPGCTLSFVKNVSPTKGNVATLDQIEYISVGEPVVEKVFARSMHIHGGKNANWSEGCLIPVPYEHVGDMLATRVAGSFDLEASRELARLWFQKAPFVISIVNTAFAKNDDSIAEGMA